VRVSECELRLAGGKDSGGDLALADGQIAGFPYSAGAIFRSGGSGFFGEAIYFGVALLAWNGKETGKFGLAVRELQRGFDGGPERIFIEAIGGGASRATIDYGAYGNSDAMLSNVLVNGVVGEAGERVDNFLDLYFGFVGSGKFTEAQHGVDALLELGFGG